MRRFLVVIGVLVCALLIDVRRVAATAMRVDAVTNAASFASLLGPVAPGELVTIYGAGMGPAGLVGTQLTADGQSVTNILAGTRVLFDGEPAPLIYTRADVVSAVVPFSTQNKTVTKVQVEYQGQASSAVEVPVASAAPGIFTNSGGAGQTVVLNQDGSLNGAASPAPLGSVITFWASGFGVTDPLLGDGQVVPVAPLPVLTQKVSVLIGGLPATATYAGPAPGMVNGVIQMNVRIPDLVASSPVTPLLVRVGNSESQPGVLLATGSVAQYRRARGRVRIANNTVVADDGVLLRGGHVALPAGSTQYANFNDDPNSWTMIRDNYNLNLVRLVCYRLPIPNWAGQAFTVDEIIPHIDKAVDNAEAAGIYIIVDYHPVGGYDANDARDFWTKVAPRYKDRTHVLYEVTNEPFAWYPDTYTWDQSALVSYEQGMYQLVRSLAPATHIILWSFPNIASSTPGAVAALVDKGSQILYDNASVGFHPYQWDAGVIDQLTRLRQKYPVVNTEFESEVFYSAPPATIQQMEQLGISWVWLGDKLFAGGSGPAPWPQPFWPRDPAAISVDAGLVSGGAPSSGLRLWLKADVGVNVSGSGVADWADQSGANLSSSQPDASRRPTLVSGAANGQPAVVFDGVGQFLNLPLAVEGWSDATIVLVSASTADRDGGASRSESAAIFWDETLPWASTYLSPFQSRVNFRFGTTQQGNYPAYLPPSSVGSSYTLSVAVKAGTTDSLYVNGTLVLAETGKQTTIHGTAPTGVLGKGYNGTFFPGGIAEVLVYARALSDAERNSVEQYLKNKYHL